MRTTWRRVLGGAAAVLLACALVPAPLAMAVDDGTLPATASGAADAPDKQPTGSDGLLEGLASDAAEQPADDAADTDDGAAEGSTETRQPVARFNGREFAALDAALEAANVKKGGEPVVIELLADATTEGLNLSRDVTIQAATFIAKKPTVTFTKYGIALWGSHLTFKGCNVTMNGIGSTPYTSEWGWMTVCASTNAKMTLDGVEMKMDAEGVTNNPHAIYFCNDNVLNMQNGSTLEIKNYPQDALEWDGGNGGYNINIDGSTFISDNNRSGFTGTFVATIRNSEVKVVNSTGNGSNGSHFEIKDSTVDFSNNGSHGLSAGWLTIDNSTVSANNNHGMGISVNDYFTVSNKSTVTVSGNADNTSYGYAAVRLYNDFDFSVDSTSKLYITDNHNTGLYVRKGRLTVEDGAKLEITGNKVSHRALDGYGGGIYLGYGANYDPVVTLPADAKIYNNHALTGGDDIYISKGIDGPTLTFGQTGDGWRLDGVGAGGAPDDCTDAIDGWYLDGAVAQDGGSYQLDAGKRWEAHGDSYGGLYTELYDPWHDDGQDAEGDEDAGEVSLFDSFVSWLTGGDSSDGESGAGINAGAGDAAGGDDEGAGDNADGDAGASGGSGVGDAGEASRVTVAGPMALKAAHGIQSVAVMPASITVYMGGSEGYEGVIGDGDGEIVESDSLPEPGFYFTLPNDVNEALKAAGIATEGEGANLSDLMHIYTYGYEEDGQEVELRWKVEQYGDSHSSTSDGTFIYRIVPEEVEGRDPVPARLRFFDKDGNEAFTSDTFDPATIDALYEQYQMQLYTELVDAHQIVFEIEVPESVASSADDGDGLAAAGNGEAGSIAGPAAKTRYFCSMQLGEGMLTIRYVTGSQDEVVTPVVNDIDEAEVKDGQAVAVVPEGTRFVINDSAIDVTDDAAPSLLFDDVVSKDDTEEDGRRDYDVQLRNRALDTLAASGVNLGNVRFEAKYLDLVDAHNGNTWLRAVDASGAEVPVTVYWPYPAGTSSSTTFYLVHFPGLDRELDNDEIEGTIVNASTEVVQVRTTEHGIEFTTTGFSPFVVMWERSGSSGTDPDEPSGPVDPDTPTDPGGPTGPDEPADPDDPTEPDGPASPDEPVGPDSPSTPADPESPAVPGDQDDPDGGGPGLPSTGDVAPFVALGAAGAGAATLVAAAILRRKES